MNSRATNTEHPDRGGLVLYVSLSILVAVIVYAMMILPLRG